jgi:hypothetical protein
MKVKHLVYIILIVSLLLASNRMDVQATTYSTITFSGDPATDFASDEVLATDNGWTFYLTWDSTYIYLAVTGLSNWYNSDGNYSEGVYIAFDTDPDTLNSGGNSEFGGMEFSDSKGRPEVIFYWENGVCTGGENPKEHRQSWSGSSWNSANDVSTYTDWIGYSNNGNGLVEWRIPWEDIDTSSSTGDGGGFSPGSNNPLGVYMWVFEEGDDQCVGQIGNRDVLATMPTGNPTGDRPQTVSHRIYYDSIASGIAPDDFPNAPTAVTLSDLSARATSPALLVASVLLLGAVIVWRRKRA